MVALLVFLLILFEMRSGQSQNMELNCKPRHGCHLPRCDPSPVDHLGVLKRNEYPMSCVETQLASVTKNRFGTHVTRREYTSLVSLYRRQLTEVNGLKSDIAALQKKEERLHIVTRLNGRRWNQTQLSVKNLMQAISVLQNENINIKKELADVRRKNVTRSSDRDKIEELERSVANVLAIVKDLKRKNRLLEIEIEELKKARKTSPQIARSRVVPTRWTPTRTTTSRSSTTTTTPSGRRTNSPTSKPPSPSVSSANNCELTFGGHCFFLILRKRRDLNFKTAQEECSKLGASSALITSEQSYRAVMDFMRRKVTSIKLVWTGMLYDPLSKRMLKPNLSYVKWAPGAPFRHQDSRTIMIRVSNPIFGDELLGMINIASDMYYDAVLCQTGSV